MLYATCHAHAHAHAHAHVHVHVVHVHVHVCPALGPTGPMGAGVLTLLYSIRSGPWCLELCLECLVVPRSDTPNNGRFQHAGKLWRHHCDRRARAHERLHHAPSPAAAAHQSTSPLQRERDAREIVLTNLLHLPRTRRWNAHMRGG